MFYRMGYNGIDTGARNEARGAKSMARRAQSQYDFLEHDMERLLMITEALWSFMKKEHGYSDEQLIRKIAEIDMRDGKMDGKVATGEPRKCPKCDRTLNRDRPFCMYCGTKVLRDPFER